MLLDGHSAQSIVDRLGISGTNLLYRWKSQQLENAGPVGEALALLEAVIVKIVLADFMVAGAALDPARD